MTSFHTIHGRPIDPERFYAQALDTARRNLPYAQGALQAAREALQEAHSSLGQPVFFAALDALGGQDALLRRLVQTIESSQDLREPTPWGLSLVSCVAQRQTPAVALDLCV